MILRGGILADGRHRDIRIEDGQITAVEPTLRPTTAESVIDVTDYLLFPGAIDAHVHFREPGGAHKETWATGSRAAAAGGVTTVIEQPNTDPPTTTGEAFDLKASRASASVIDYGLNGGVTPTWDPDSLFERPLCALGEVFLADSTGDMGIDTSTFRQAALRARAEQVPVTVHAEDERTFDPSALDAASGRGRDASVDRWSQYRPPTSEIQAVKQAITVAEAVDVPVHIAHASTPTAIDLVADRSMTCEVTPHHALLSRADSAELGTYGRMNPPLRSADRRAAVFERLVEGQVDLIATDHAPHTRAEKDTSLVAAPSGVPGVETMLPVFLATTRETDLSLPRLRDLTATTPASVFGLSSKGRIAPGYDADIAVFDRDRLQTVTPDQLHSKADWSPFAGHPAIFPLLTLLRGQMIYRDPASSIRLPTTMSVDEQGFGPAIGQNVCR